MWRVVVVAVGCFLLAGCGPPGAGDKSSVKGKLTYKNQPVNGAVMLLYPTSGTTGSSEASATITTTQDGSFNVTDVAPGDYAVAVQGRAADPGPSTAGMSADQIAKMQPSLDKQKSPGTIAFPDFYKDRRTTKLSIKIQKGSNDLGNLELKDQ